MRVEHRRNGHRRSGVHGEDLLTRPRARAVALLAAALLVALALAACGRHEASSSPTAPQPSYTALDTSGSSDSPRAGPSGSPDSSSSAATPTDLPGPTAPDPAASELDQINQLINDIDNSVQSSDAGGE